MDQPQARGEGFAENLFLIGLTQFGHLFHHLDPRGGGTRGAEALGDALAMALLVRKGFRQEDFANLHPGGKLGKKLMRAEQLMHTGDALPVVRMDTPMRDVVYEMSRKGLGMTCVVETGIPLQARISKPLLVSIFNPRSPLHDGAVVIHDRTLEAARVTLPLSQTDRIGDTVLGMRHRAALGISEQADVIAVVVSEETGTISLADNGLLLRGLSTQDLRNELRASSLGTPTWGGSDPALDWHGAAEGPRSIGAMHVPFEWLDRQDALVASRVSQAVQQ